MNNRAWLSKLIAGNAPWDVAMRIHPAQLAEYLTVHDSSIIDPITIDTAQSRAVVCFDWDTHWNMNLLIQNGIETDASVLILAFNGVTALESGDRVERSGYGPINTVEGISVSSDVSGYCTTIELLQRPDIRCSHGDEILALCYDDDGYLLPFNKEPEPDAREESAS